MSLLRKKLIEIAQGQTKSKFQGRTIYFKHLNEAEQMELDEFEENWRREMIDLGMPTKAQRLETAAEDGSWTKDQEVNYQALQKEFEWFYNDKPKFTSVNQIDGFFNTVKSMRDELGEVLEQRARALGTTAEEDAQFETYNQEIRVCSFLDTELKLPFFEDYDNLDPSTIAQIHSLYYEEISSMRSDNFKTLKKLCCQPFFTAKFCISENPFYFFNKPIWSLTHYQTYLLALGRRFLDVMRHCNDAPEEYYEEPDKLECYSMMMQDGGGEPETNTSDLFKKIKAQQK